ncbi:alanine--tRNA ligase [Streptomyces sp. B6B3]|uniref:alanine--tRNA ligase n=1 Tax=Streptomyces sp. B6B3 TaxID=3153570 RepID=UPI00325DE2CF
MRTHELSQRFQNFFAARGHKVVPSASLIFDDPNLLFVNAGMVPFKPYFLGDVTPPDKRVTSVQKCVRTGDIDEVGKATRYNTFFQMAGNFSFADYFREEAISWAWELITTAQSDGGLGLDPARLWVTVYQDDEEAVRLWRGIAGLPESRIQRLGKADNFWSMGVPGPCGPCSEIFYDRGPEFGPDGGPAVDTERFLEIWNLVFMESERGEGTDKENFPILGPLPAKNIDTGMGLERTSIVLQDVANVYETDLLRPVIDRTEDLSGQKYGAKHQTDVLFRVIADHARSGVMLVNDGVTPGNEGRGYVLRRLLRRIVRSTRLLGVDEPILREFATVVLDMMAPSYPELVADFERIATVMENEETAFLTTLASGLKIFDLAVRETSSAGGSVLPGAKAFQLHDTYGFPIDLTLEMAAEKNLTVDEDGFRQLMAEQRARAKADAAARKTGHADGAVYKPLLDLGATEFTGYQELESEATVRGVVREGTRVASAEPGDVVNVVLDRTPLYAESGGQASDAGTMLGDGLELEVLDVQKVHRKLWVHQVRVRSGELREGDHVLARVDPEWRTGARQAHSGTHVVHAALRQVLGPNALQRGSFNKPGYLRLDFAWQQGLSEATRSEIEEVANLAVRRDLPVSVAHMTMAEARDLGALALFGETYDETVRVVEIGGAWSRELCGGTHVAHSSQIGPVALVGESSVGSGQRRVEAYVGIESFRYLARERTLVRDISEVLKVPGEEIPAKIESLLERLRSAEKELEQLRQAELRASAAALAGRAESLGGVSAVVSTDHDVPGGTLRTMASQVRDRLGQAPGVVALFSVVDGGKVAVCVATTAAGRSAGLAANRLLAEALPHVEGRGGGSPELAQGAGKASAGIPQAAAALRRALAG